MEITNNVSSNIHKLDQDSQSPKTSKSTTNSIRAYQKEAEKDATVSKKLSKMEMERLIANLNDEISLISTDLRFGYNDKADVLQVSIINKETDEIIRRFPTEEAVALMSSMKEFIGLLLDKQG